jgi:hypothetical protein
MTVSSVVSKTAASSIEFALPPASTSDATGIARDIMQHALEFCAQKSGVDGVSSGPVAQSVRQAGSNVGIYLRYGIASGLAARLGQLDESVRAVYLYEYEATAEDLAFCAAQPATPIHLIVWAAHKTGALRSLVAGLARAITEQYAETVGTDTPRHLLDVQIVDDAEVEGHTGYAGLLRSVHQPPLTIWRR